MTPPRRFAASAIIRATAAALAFASQVLLVRLLGADVYGGYVVFVTSCALLALVANGGLDVITTRRISTGHDRGEGHRIVHDIRCAGMQTLALAGMTCGVLIALRASSLLSDWQLLSSIGMPTLFLGVATLALATLGSAAVRGLHGFIAADVIDFLARPLALMAGVTGLALFAPTATPTAPAAFVVANLLAVGLCALVVRHAIAVMAQSRNTAPAGDNPSLRPSAMLVAYGLMSYAMFQLDTLLVGSYRSTLEVGAYNMACNFVRLVIFVPLIIVAQMQPRVAVLFSRGEHDALAALVRNRVSIALLSSGGTATALAFAGRPLLQMVDPQFVSAAPALVILCFAHVCNSVLLVLSGTLLMGGLQGLVLRAQVCGLAVCVPLYVMLIPEYGASGAAVAVLAGLSVNLAAIAWLLYRLRMGGPR